MGTVVEPLRHSLLSKLGNCKSQGKAAIEPSAVRSPNTKQEQKKHLFHNGMSVRDSVQGIVSAPGDAGGKMQKLTQLVGVLVGQKDVNSLQQLVDIILSDDTQFSLYSRPVLHELAVKIKDIGAPQSIKMLAQHTIDKLRGRVTSYEEEDALLREALSEVLMNENEHTAAAKVLAAVNYEGGVGGRQRTSEEKADKYVLIAELYLEDGDAVAAETYCNRAGLIIHEVTDKPITLRFKVVYARILDSKRRFMDAATRYFELSQNLQSLPIEPADLLQLLTNAVTCAILAPAGPQRSRLLASLMKDERIARVHSYEVLKRMFLGRIIKKDEVHKFSEKLEDHHKAVGPDGTTLLDKAMLQHNVLAASRVYLNMRLIDFGALLDVPRAQAEKMAAKMIQEKRMEGFIDQSVGVIHFGKAESEHLKQWDDQVQALCHRANVLAQEVSGGGDVAMAM
eukprot:GDKI01013835.1.p1 GENE.GDKI01013835.1~~GDKI01013835.1.p1  ORF type:complete len:452 (-),score=131.29 GDKI01013835.1:125-1480(-)